jgi:hypothetical protein
VISRCVCTVVFRLVDYLPPLFGVRLPERGGAASSSLRSGVERRSGVVFEESLRDESAGQRPTRRGEEERPQPVGRIRPVETWREVDAAHLVERKEEQVRSLRSVGQDRSQDTPDICREVRELRL